MNNLLKEDHHIEETNKTVHRFDDFQKKKEEQNLKNTASDRWMRIIAFVIVFIVIIFQICFVDCLFFKIWHEKLNLTDHQLNLLIGATLFEIYALSKIMVAYLFPKNEGFLETIVSIFRK